MSTGETQPRAAELAVGRRWTFGPAVLDEGSLELTVNGALEQLERKPLEVLLYLLHHAGEVVTKDDLAENLWPGRILTETVLTRCISLLRQALGDADKSLVRTVHGFGYRLVADVRVESGTSTPPPPAFDFKPGDHPPLRTQWKLTERLGTGGHGDVWLARHDKTGDARVFKFALDAGALTSLKREITLYRLLHDTLGRKAAVARILEWNLEEPPYFIEMEYVTSGNLQAWSEAQGGISAIPLDIRLGLVAQIADALAAAHSVGALHKDLKPGNVLVQVEDGKPMVRLCDFGSGGVLDPERLEALGITRLGFTDTLKGSASGTPLYLAPEVIAGQPFTVQADIYALGVLLYQVVAGDLRKPLAPGWEADVSDELLREDIAMAAAGNPARRLTDAAQLSERLRNLEARRKARAAEVAALRRAEQAREIQQKLWRMRVYVLVLLGATAAASAGGVIAYKARNEALAATRTAEAISGFLTEDVLRLDSGVFKPSEASYEALLERAAREVGNRLKSQPKAAADVHLLLGRRYQEIGQFEVATAHYERAVELFTDLYGRSATPTLMALDRLGWAQLETGRSSEALAIAGQLAELWKLHLAPTDLASLMVRLRGARFKLVAGDIREAEKDLLAVIGESPGGNPSSPMVKMFFQQWLGLEPPPELASEAFASYANLLLAFNALEELGDEKHEAEPRLRDALASFAKIWGRETELSAMTCVALSIVLAHEGTTAEAERFASRAMTFFDETFPARHFARAIPKLGMFRLRVEQRRLAEATALARESVDLCPPQSACPARMRAELLWELGRIHLEAGRWQEAVDTLRSALEINERLRGGEHVLSFRIRVGMADGLIQIGKTKDASEVLAGIDREARNRLLPYQEANADLHRAEGLLFLANGELDRARPALQEALNITARRKGSNHWRSDRVRAELARIP